MASRFRPYAAQKECMSGGCIAAIVIAVIAVVVAIIFGVLYGTSGTNKIVIETPKRVNAPIILAQKPQQVPSNTLDNAKPVEATTHKNRAVLGQVNSDSLVGSRNDQGSKDAHMKAHSTAGMSTTYANAVHSRHAASSAPHTLEELSKAQQGVVPHLINHVEGNSLQHVANTAIKATGSLHNDFTEHSNLAAFDPEGAAKVDAALKMTGTPSRFHNSETQEHSTRRAAILDNLKLAGKADASAAEILSATAPIVGTKNMLLRAANSASSLSSNIVLRTPMRFYNNPLVGSRPAVPLPSMSPILPQTNIYPGQEIYMTSLQCATADKPIVMDNY